MTGEHEDLLVRLAEFQRTHRFGKYGGIVHDISDARETLCIRAMVPAVYGDAPSPLAMPSLPFAGRNHGLVWLPEVGDGVWIEFEGGDTARPIWSGCWWAKGQLPAPEGKPVDEKVRLLATSAGHQIVIDEEANEIKLVHPGGAQLTMSGSEITLKLGVCELKITASEITLNEGMAKVTKRGVSLVDDGLKLGG